MVEATQSQIVIVQMPGHLGLDYDALPSAGHPRGWTVWRLPSPGAGAWGVLLRGLGVERSGDGQRIAGTHRSTGPRPPFAWGVPGRGKRYRDV